MLWKQQRRVLNNILLLSALFGVFWKCEELHEAAWSTERAELCRIAKKDAQGCYRVAEIYAIQCIDKVQSNAADLGEWDIEDACLQRLMIHWAFCNKTRKVTRYCHNMST